MTTITIDLPDEKAAIFTAQAKQHGLTLETWATQKLTEIASEIGPDSRSVDAAIEHILDLQKQVEPDPEGWTIKDYINYGRP